MSDDAGDVPAGPTVVASQHEESLGESIAVESNTADLSKASDDFQEETPGSLDSREQSEAEEEGDNTSEAQPPPKQQTESDEYDTDLEIEVEVGTSSAYTATWSSVYLESCKELNVVPASYFMRFMREEELVMKHHGVGPMGAKAMAIPLVTNTSVTKLDLEENCLGPVGAKFISEMLKENCYIADLSLANNGIGSQGAPALGDMLQNNSSLRSLNLSGNSFQDKDAQAFADGILEHNLINKLDLSHNNFSDTGQLLGHALGENESLEVLDLSWNHFRGQSAVALIDGIKVNSRLKQVDISWNGIGDVGALAVGDCLKNNSILLEVDVSSNRIGPEGAAAVAKGIDPNESLKVFKMGKNPIGPSGALSLLNAMNNERSVVQELILEDVSVDKEFKKLHEEMTESRQLKIKHGGVLSDYVIVLPKRKKRDYAKPIRVFIKENEISVDEFIEEADFYMGELCVEDVWACFDDVGIDISFGHVDRLAERLEAKVDEETVDCSVFVPKLTELLKVGEEPAEEQEDQTAITTAES